MGEDSGTETKLFLGVFLLREMGFQRKSHFFLGGLGSRNGSKEKVRFKIALEPDSRNPVSLPVLNFLMNFVTSILGFCKFVFPPVGDIWVIHLVGQNGQAANW